MSIARGDLARRAALADNLAVPEPWSSNDDPRVFAAIRDLRDEFRRLGVTDPDGKGRLPDFLLDYENLPPIKPTTLDRAHTRNSSATRWDQNGNLVEDSSDTLRLQRDPKTQEPLGLLYEPKRTQILLSPTDLSSADWGQKDGVTVTSNAGSAKGQPYDTLTEDTGSGGHRVFQSFTGTTDGTPVSASMIVKSTDRQFAFFDVRMGGTSLDVFFDISSGVTGSVESNSAVTVIEHSIQDLGGGWYHCKFSAEPDAGSSSNQFTIGMAKSDLSTAYTGNGSAQLQVLHAQLEESREVTTPILTGGATRGADEVDYRFDFPDKTTGVAYSIEQQAGGDFTGIGGYALNSLITFGLTSDQEDDQHGVLHYGEGLNDSGEHGSNPGDGFKTISRNSDNDSLDPDSVLDQTIDRFEVRQSNNANDRGASFTVRQIAIHTQPHTQAQKDALADQYLTKP